VRHSRNTGRQNGVDNHPWRDSNSFMLSRYA